MCWHSLVGGALWAAGATDRARGQRGLGGADHVYPFTTRHTQPAEQTGAGCADVHGR